MLNTDQTNQSTADSLDCFSSGTDHMVVRFAATYAINTTMIVSLIPICSEVYMYWVKLAGR